MAEAEATSHNGRDHRENRAALGTLFLTVLLDLLGFGLVVPFLPGEARLLGASDFEATLLAASYSLMQFLFVPLWGRLSDRIGRRPVLLGSIALTAVGWSVLAAADSLPVMFLARIGTGMATANIAVAQAYVADVTTPETRARGMGLIGMAFGIGFIMGPFFGGELGHFVIHGRNGVLAALAAAGLSVVNFALALKNLRESLPAEARRHAPPRKAPGRFGALAAVAHMPGVTLLVIINFCVIFWFAGMEQTFRLFTEDEFQMSVAGTGRVLGLVGIVAAVVQGGLIGRLTQRFGELHLLRVGIGTLAVAFVLMGTSPRFASSALLALFIAAALTALGSGLSTPSLSSLVSRRAGVNAQGVSLGALQSASALARTLGPATGGLVYQVLGHSAPYLAGAAGFVVALALALRVRPAA